MSKIAVATDSNSGITQAQAKQMGIRVLPIPFFINEELLPAPGGGRGHLHLPACTGERDGAVGRPAAGI